MLSQAPATSRLLVLCRHIADRHMNHQPQPILVRVHDPSSINTRATLIVCTYEYAAPPHPVQRQEDGNMVLDSWYPLGWHHQSGVRAGWPFRLGDAPSVGVNVSTGTLASLDSEPSVLWKGADLTWKRARRGTCERAAAACAAVAMAYGLSFCVGIRDPG